MATPAPENIPNLNTAALHLDTQVSYEEVAVLRDFATQELLGSLHFRQVRHGDRQSGCKGIVRFGSSGDYGSENEQPVTSYSLQVAHNYSPPGWLLSFGVKKMLDSQRGSYEQTLYRMDTMNGEVWQAFIGRATLSRTTDIRFEKNRPVEVPSIHRTRDVESLTTEGCIDLLILMDRVMRRALHDQPPVKYSVKHASHALDIEDKNF